VSETKTSISAIHDVMWGCDFKPTSKILLKSWQFDPSTRLGEMQKLIIFHVGPWCAGARQQARRQPGRKDKQKFDFNSINRNCHKYVVVCSDYAENRLNFASLPLVVYGQVSNVVLLRATAVPAGTGVARISHGDSVRPSVCPSVCLGCHDPEPNQARVRQRLRVFTIW